MPYCVLVAHHHHLIVGRMVEVKETLTSDCIHVSEVHPFDENVCCYGHLQGLGPLEELLLEALDWCACGSTAMCPV